MIACACSPTAVFHPFPTFVARIYPGMITEQTRQQILNRIDIIDVVGDYVKLKKRGANYLGLCPFHHEKTPSFTVSATKGIYKCFGCGKSGNTISFLMEHDKLSYPDALRWLAARYNIEVEETESSPEQKLAAQTADSLYIINQFAQQFFRQQLVETEEGKAIAGSYLEERGFTPAILEKFQIGYNPESGNQLTKALLANQFNQELLPKTGLTAQRQTGELIDNYRGRIIFPIHNANGKIIGFGARLIGKSDKAPKYINTPENEIYHKSRVLYGIYFARTAINRQDECLLVEGYTDVISLHQAGIENVVASGGTSLTTEQLRLIRKYTQHLTIIYDGDNAGVKAAMRGLDMAVEEGLQVQLVLIPDQEDPDSYVHKIGAPEFREFIARSKKDFILFQLEIMLREAGTDLHKKSEAVNQIAETLSRISKAEDFTKQQDYIRQCATLLKIDEGGLTTLVNKYKRERLEKEERRQFNQQATEPTQPDTVDQPPPPDLSDDLLQQDLVQEKNMLRVLLEYGQRRWDDTHRVADFIFGELDGFRFDHPDMEELFDTYHSMHRNGQEPDIKTLLYHDKENIRNLVVQLTLTPFELSLKWDEVLETTHVVHKDTSVQDVIMSLCFFKLRKIKRMFEENQRDMENAVLEDQLRLIEVHKHLKEIEKELTRQLGTVIIK